jgi:hypothetical protein
VPRDVVHMAVEFPRDPHDDKCEDAGNNEAIKEHRRRPIAIGLVGGRETCLAAVRDVRRAGGF